MATLNELKRELATAQQARRDVLATGKEYSIPGGLTVKNHDLSTLDAEITRIKREILRRSGYNPRRAAPDFR